MRALREKLRAQGVLRADYLSWVELRIGEWEDAGVPPSELKAAVSAVLKATDEQLGPHLAKHYFALHERLAVQHMLNPAQATALLGQAFLIADLADRDVMSAAQIARVVEAKGVRGASRQSVMAILSSLRLKRAIELDAIKRQHHTDVSIEPARFADADLAAACSIVGEAGLRLGFPGDIESALQEIGEKLIKGKFAPHVQILHYQCITAEFFDHVLSDLYEFMPRGAKALWLFKQYPPSVAGAGNPFLNNAKAVEQISDSWARSRKPAERPSAWALVDILRSLDRMDFSSRRELASLLRMWIHRAIRLAIPAAVPIPLKLSIAQTQALLAALAKANSKTFGVLEQRTVDLIASLKHPDADGWRARGIGDSINCSNLSRRKLGDCDFQHSADRRVVAYEAHGGVLTDLYVKEHTRTLAKALQLRLQELRGIADPAEWTIEVTFVAERVAPGVLPISPTVIEGVTISFSAMTFEDFLSGFTAGTIPADKLATLLISPLTERRTPQETREAFLKIIGP